MKRTLLKLAVALGYGCTANVLWILFLGPVDRWTPSPSWLVGTTLLAAVAAFFALSRLSPAALGTAGRVLALGLLPLWGLAINHGLPDCNHACADPPRLLATPEVYGLFGAYGATGLAYAIARARTEALRPLGELLLLATLMAGVALMAALLVQFSPWIVMGLLFAPIGLPLIAPALVAGLYLHAIWQRLHRHADPDSVPPPLLGFKALAATPVLLGLAAVLQAAWSQRSALAVFTQTCQTPFGQLVPPICHDHYLCTIAAQGHPALVRPLRLGRRHGQPIVVNRQLAVANAFEDLLRERWPRLQRLSRRVYDRLAWPLSQHLRRRILADAVYLAMKPAEWLFYLTLLLLDPRPPEQRIAQMYR